MADSAPCRGSKGRQAVAAGCVVMSVRFALALALWATFQSAAFRQFRLPGRR